MGNSASLLSLDGRYQEKFRSLLPSYYVEEKPSSYDIMMAEHSWELVQNGSGRRYNENIRSQKSLPPCSDWFWNNYFCLFVASVEDSSRVEDMSKMPNRNQAFSDMIRNIISSLHDEFQLRNTLCDIAEFMAKNNFRYQDYRTLGSTFFNTFATVLGEDYCNETHTAWLRIMSLVMSILIPIAVVLESGDCEKEALSCPTFVKQQLSQKSIEISF